MGWVLVDAWTVWAIRRFAALYSVKMFVKRDVSYAELGHYAGLPSVEALRGFDEALRGELGVDGADAFISLRA